MDESDIVQSDERRVSIPRTEFDALLRHLQQVEEFMSFIEQRARRGELDKETSERWSRFKEFLLQEELPGSEDEDGEEDGTYCCTVYVPVTLQVVARRTYKTYYAWAWAKCLATKGPGMWATLKSGKCP